MHKPEFTYYNNKPSKKYKFKINQNNIALKLTSVIFESKSSLNGLYSNKLLIY